MHYQYHPYILPAIVSAFISVSLGIYTLYRHRNVKGAMSFMFSMFLVTIWSAGNALEMAGTDFPTKLFWANMQYFAYCYSPVTLLALCMEFSGYDRWIENRKVIWLAVLPTIIILLVWTDLQHGLVRYDLHMEYSGVFPVIAKSYGSLFYIHALYSHFLNIFAGTLLVREVLFRKSVYRKQAFALLLGMSLIVVPNILYISGLSPEKRFDLTPAFFAPAGLIIAWAIFRYKMFDIVPLAWATVIKTMNAGVMVLDLRNRVLDINPFFTKLLGINESDVLSKQAEEVLINIPELIDYCTNPTISSGEISISKNEKTSVYEIWISQLKDKKGNLIGRLVMLSDITQKNQVRQEYQKQQWKLAVTKERERLAKDLHDNLAQMLGFINFQTEGIRQELINARVRISEDQLDKLVVATQSAHNEIREYIRQARSTRTINKNFATALTKDIKSFEDLWGIKIELHIHPHLYELELSPKININLSYIIREALNNIGKHAEAENVDISLSIAEGELFATIKDDGKGFDFSDDNSKMCFGINIMRERAWEISAHLEIISEKGNGSRIALRLPLGEEKNLNASESDAGR